MRIKIEDRIKKTKDTIKAALVLGLPLTEYERRFLCKYLLFCGEF